MTASESDRLGKTFFLTLFMLTIFVVAASYVLVLLMGFGFIFFTSEGLALSVSFRDFPVLLFLFLIGFYTPQLLVGGVFGLVWLVYVACFVAAWRWRESFHIVAAKTFSRPLRSVFNNFLFAMPLLSGMVLTAAWVIISSQELVGVPTGQPVFPSSFSQQEVFLNLAYAPVIEELGFRLVPIGLFTVFNVFLYGKKVMGGGFRLFAASFFYPEGAKRMAGLRNVGEHGFWRGISRSEWIMVLATSTLFAVAHIISGVGWEAGKVTSVFVQGFFFAVTYLAYGFEAPILLHWFFNYYLFFFDPEIVTRFFPGTEPMLSVVELLILGLGVVGWALFAVAGVRRLTRRRRTMTETPPPPATLPTQPTLPS